MHGQVLKQLYIAELKGEASNRGARVAVSLYAYIYPSRSVRDTSITQESRRRLVHYSGRAIAQHSRPVCAAFTAGLRIVRGQRTIEC